MLEHGLPNVYLDMRPINKREIARHFPNIQKRCAEYGIDIHKDPIPVSPAAHYFMGGISADIDGNTSMPGLYAIGECACTGLHGANRLASNSLLEAGVMALRVAKLITQQSEHAGLKNSGKEIESILMPSFTKPSHLSAVRRCMSQDVGIIRSAKF